MEDCRSKLGDGGCDSICDLPYPIFAPLVLRDQRSEGGVSVLQYFGRLDHGETTKARPFFTSGAIRTMAGTKGNRSASRLLRARRISNPKKLK